MEIEGKRHLQAVFDKYRTPLSAITTHVRFTQTYRLRASQLPAKKHSQDPVLIIVPSSRLSTQRISCHDLNLIMANPEDHASHNLDLFNPPGAYSSTYDFTYRAHHSF
jgi:hypothetical protein